MKKTKTLCVPICNRSNYSKLKPVLLGLQKFPVNIKMLPSSDMALESVPTAIGDIGADGFSVDRKINCLMMDDTLACMGKTIGVSMIEHSAYFEMTKPDMLLVVGDRFDILPAVLSAKIQNIPILHMQGGERSGSIDDTMRDLISVCSSRHYVATHKSYENVVKLAKANNVFNFGCPAVENILKIEVGDQLDTRRFKKQYQYGFGIVPGEEYLLVIVHPDTEDDKDVDMNILLDACLSFGKKIVAIHPNIDAFNSKIQAGLKKHYGQIIHARHMPLEDFIQVMAHCTCMIGNSSAGIREAASFGVPVVNVGDRQRGRERNKNTLDCSNSTESILEAIKQSLSIGKYPKENVYFQPNATQRICGDIATLL